MILFWLGNEISKGKELPVIDFPGAVFDEEYEVGWLNAPLAKDIIKEIDNADHIKDHFIESPILGAIPPQLLSTGCKSVLLAAFHPGVSHMFLDGARMDDDCFPVLIKVARETGRDVKVRVGRLLRERWEGDDEIKFMPTGDTVRGYDECFEYLADHTGLFYKGENYGTQG